MQQNDDPAKYSAVEHYLGCNIKEEKEQSPQTDDCEVVL